MVEIYEKSRKWEPAVLKRPGDVIEMPEFGLCCVVADLYAGTVLDRDQPGSYLDRLTSPGGAAALVTLLIRFGM